MLALSHWRVSGVDGRNRLELNFLESVLPENSDWICENSRSSGKKPNFDPKPRKTRNDSSYQFVGDFSGYTSKPLKDFIYESNKGRDIFFVSSEEDAIEKLSRT